MAADVPPGAPALLPGPAERPEQSERPEPSGRPEPSDRVEPSGPEPSVPEPSVPEPSVPAPGGPQGGFDVRSDGEVATVRFWGAVDLAVRLAATTDLHRLPHDATALRVDCRDVTFMDSTGLSVLVRVLRDATAEGRPVRFVGAAPQVRDLLEATGVDRWMESLGVRAGE